MNMHPVFIEILSAHGMPHRPGKALTQEEKWQVVGKVFSDCEACEGCSRYEARFDAQPYGEGFANEVYSVCTLGDLPGDRPEDCPAFESETKGEDL